MEGNGWLPGVRADNAPSTAHGIDAPAAGKRTLTEQLVPQPSNGPARQPQHVHEAATREVSSDTRHIPHGTTIQHLFGRNEVAEAQEHISGAAPSESADAPATTATAPSDATAAMTVDGGQPVAAPDSVSATGAAPLAAAAPPALAPSVRVPGIVRVTAAGGLRVRRTPDAKNPSNVLGGLKFHEEVEAHACVGEWVAVTYRMMTAYVHGGYLEAAPPATDATTSAPPAHSPSSSAHPAPAPQATPSHGATSSAPASSPGESSSASGTTPHSTPASAAAELAPAQPATGEFTTLSGNAIAKTTAKEAAVLNALRSDPRRFSPSWLVTAQRALGVVDATGAMNTETLRAMRSRSGNPSLGATGVLNASFLTGIAPGAPFLDSQEGFVDQAADARATRPADRAAQAVGYASYAAYQADWVPITFLARELGRGHPYLAARVQAAETFLRQRHPGQNDAAVTRAIGWNGRGNASYDDAPATQNSHQHTMGLAIDIDPSHNPYIFNEHVGGLTHEQSMWWIDTFKEMFRVSTKIYGGEAIAPDTLMQWSKESSSEELFQRVNSASSAFKQYLDLSTKPDDQIVATLTGAGYSDDEAKALLPSVKAASGRFRAGSRRDATSITNIQEELLIALRDVAGLSWGGTEMSMRENGDFMHFDCRNTTFGYAVYSRRAPASR